MADRKRVAMKANSHTISVEEAGRLYFGLSKTSAYAAVRAGRIPAIRIGKRAWRVPVRALDAMLAGAVLPATPLVMRDEEWPGYG